MAKRKNSAQASVTATGVICTMDLSDYDNVGWVVGGTFVGTVTPQVSQDGVTWAPFGTALTAPGSAVQLDAPFKYIRLNCTAYTSGTIVGMLGASKAA